MTSSAFDSGQIEPTESLRIRQNVDLDDPAAGEREAEHAERSPIRTARHDSNASVHQDDMIREAQLRERGGLCSHGVSATHHARRARERSAIGSQHDVWIEHGDQALEVAVAGRRQKGVEHPALLLPISVRRRRLTLDASPSTARKLPRRNRRTVHDRRDLLERHPEHVVKDKRQALGGLQFLEHNQEREADRVGEHGVRLQIPVGASDHRIGDVHIQEILPT